MIEKKPVGIKDFQGKVQMALVPFEAVEAIAKVLTVAIESGKYKRDNWKYVEDAEFMYKCAMLRHLCAYMRGEIIDPTDGLPHLDKIATNASFLIWFQKQKENKTATVDGTGYPT